MSHIHVPKMMPFQVKQATMQHGTFALSQVASMTKNPIEDLKIPAGQQQGIAQSDLDAV
jgi:hypothetical protein